jgi:hypothetical protein
MTSDVHSNAAMTLYAYGGAVPAHRYRITVSGALGEVGREVFGDLRIERDGANTVLIGDLDEAALYGVLDRVLVLGLDLVELSRRPERAK